MKKSKIIGIYKILNKINNKFYIGSSIDVNHRIRTHRQSLRDNKHYNIHLQTSWNKYGEENFEFIILEQVDNMENLRAIEAEYIKTTNCCNPNVGYNILPDTNVGLGVSASLEVKKKISEKCKGKNNGNYGRKHTYEELKLMQLNRWGMDYDDCIKKRKEKEERKSQREELRKQKLQKKETERLEKEMLKFKKEQYKQLLKDGNISKEDYYSIFPKKYIMSEESRKRMSEKAKGRKLSQEARRKISEKMKGRKLTENQKRNFKRKGDNNPNCKLKKEEVLDIYSKLKIGYSYVQIKDLYPRATDGMIDRINKKESWVFKND